MSIETEVNTPVPEVDRRLGSLATASSERFGPLADENHGYAEAIVRLFPNPHVENAEPTNPISRLIRKVFPLNEEQVEDAQRKNVRGLLETTDGTHFSAVYTYFNNELLDGFAGKVAEMAKEEEEKYPGVAMDLYQLQKGLETGDLLLRERLFVEYVEALGATHDISEMTRKHFLREFMKWKHPELSLPEKQEELRREGRVLVATADDMNTALDSRNHQAHPKFGEVLKVVNTAREFTRQRYILGMTTQESADDLIPRLRLYGLDRYCERVPKIDQYYRSGNSTYKAGSN